MRDTLSFSPGDHSKAGDFERLTHKLARQVITPLPVSNDTLAEAALELIDALRKGGVQ